MNQPSHDPLVVEAWASVSRGYADLWGPRFRPFLVEALDRFRPRVAGPLVVAGCGPGEEALALADREPQRQVLACDPAAPMLDVLRGRLAQRPRGNVRVEQADATQLPDLPGEAAGVFSSFVLQLLPDRAAALSAWGRCLAAEGLIGVVFWPRQADDDAWGHLGRAMERATGQARPDWVAPLRAALPGLGLELLEERDLIHEIAYASPAQAWEDLCESCSLQVLLRRAGPEATGRCRALWLADHGLVAQAPSRWVHAPSARFWLLARRDRPGSSTLQR